MAAARPLEIPNYIKARKPDDLRVLMIRTNAANSMTIQYFDIQFVNGYWYAWFYLPITRDDRLLSDNTESR